VLNAPAPEQPESAPTIAELTPREQEVLTHIAEGDTNREIAEALVISVKTVDRHRENIMQKLNLHSRVELVKYAISKGLINVVLPGGVCTPSKMGYIPDSPRLENMIS